MSDGSAVIVLLILAALYFLPSFVAAGRERNGGVFVLNLFLGWTLVGWVVALAWAASLEHSDEKEPLSLGMIEPKPTLVPCPYCAEEIKPEAVVCKHCGRDLPPKESAA